jgi:hypothetical protein
LGNTEKVQLFRRRIRGDKWCCLVAIGKLLVAAAAAAAELGVRSGVGGLRGLLQLPVASGHEGMKTGLDGDKWGEQVECKWKWK